MLGKSRALPDTMQVTDRWQTVLDTPIYDGPTRRSPSNAAT